MYTPPTIRRFRCSGIFLHASYFGHYSFPKDHLLQSWDLRWIIVPSQSHSSHRRQRDYKEGHSTSLI